MRALVGTVIKLYEMLGTFVTGENIFWPSNLFVLVILYILALFTPLTEEYLF
jgi:hypothetical protein